MIRENIDIIRQKISLAAKRAGRNPEDIALMAVSKTQPVDLIQEAYNEGLRLFGENRILEASEKFTGRFPGAELHLIGHIQRNKAKMAVEIASCIQTVDALRTAAALQRHAEEMGKNLEILVEIHTSGEESKMGLRDREEAFGLMETLVKSPWIQLKGLMTMAPFTTDEAPVRRAFRSLFEFRELCIPRFGPEFLKVLSMGMSGDYEIAVEEGSTLVRIGTALFGERH